MSFHAIDGYLLAGRPDKAAAIAAALRQRVPDEAAQPFYRALEALGTRVADEALVALRLVLAGKSPTDDAVRRLRALALLARADGPAARARALAKAGASVADLEARSGDAADLAAAAVAAYHATF